MHYMFIKAVNGHLFKPRGDGAGILGLGKTEAEKGKYSWQLTEWSKRQNIINNNNSITNKIIRRHTSSYCCVIEGYAMEISSKRTENLKVLNSIMCIWGGKRPHMRAHMRSRVALFLVWISIIATKPGWSRSLACKGSQVLQEWDALLSYAPCQAATGSEILQLQSRNEAAQAACCLCTEHCRAPAVYRKNVHLILHTESVNTSLLSCRVWSFPLLLPSSLSISSFTDLHLTYRGFRSGFFSILSSFLLLFNSFSISLNKSWGILRTRLPMRSAWNNNL